MCVVGTSPSPEWRKVDEAVCRFQLIYDTLECNDKYTIRYSDAQNVIPGVETEMVGSSCQFSELSIDCLCIGSGCNSPENIKYIFAKQVGMTNSLSRLQSMLCFLTDGDIYDSLPQNCRYAEVNLLVKAESLSVVLNENLQVDWRQQNATLDRALINHFHVCSEISNKTSTSLAPPLASMKDNYESTTNGKQLKMDTTAELETTERKWIVFKLGERRTAITKGTELQPVQNTGGNNCSVNESSDDTTQSKEAVAVKSEISGKKPAIHVAQKNYVTPIILYVLFGLLLLLLFCANVVFFTLVFVYMKKETEERTKSLKHDISALSKSGGA